MRPQRTPDSEPGARLRRNVDRLLAERGWTPPRLYTEMGVCPNTYSGYFKSAGGPRTATLQRIADALDVEVAELLR